MFQKNDWEKETHFALSGLFSENRAIYEIIWNIVVNAVRSQKKMWCACLLLRQGHRLALKIRNTDCFSAATSVTCRHVCISPVLSILCLRKQLQVKNDTSPSTVVHPVLLLRATRKNIFTVNTTLLILMLTSHINEAMFWKGLCLFSGHPVTCKVEMLQLH